MPRGPEGGRRPTMELRWLVVLVLGVVMRGGSDVANGSPLRTDPESATKEAVTIDDGEYRTSSIFKLLQAVTADKPPFPIRPPQDGDGGERWKPKAEPTLLGGHLHIGRDPRHLIEFFPLRPPRDNDGGGKPKPPPPYGARSPIGRDLDHLKENSPAATDGKPPATDPESATTEAVTTDNGDHKTRSVFRLPQAVTTDKPNFPKTTPRKRVEERSANGSQGVKQPSSYNLGSRSSIGQDLDHLIEAFPIRPPRDSDKKRKPDRHGAGSLIGRDLDHLIEATGDAQPMANAQNTSLETISTTFQTPPMPTSAESHMNHFSLEKEIGIVCNCVFCSQLHIAP